MTSSVTWSNAPGDVYAEHVHAYRKTITCVRGSIRFKMTDGATELGPGDRLVIEPGTRHSAVVGPEGCACREDRE